MVRIASVAAWVRTSCSARASSLRDPLHRLLGAALQAGLELDPVALGLALGLGPRLLDDRLRLVLARGQLALVLGEQALRLLAQALGLVQLGAHLGGVAVERAEDRPGQRLVDDRDQDDQRDQQPELEHQAASSTHRAQRRLRRVRWETSSPARRSAAAWAAPTAASSSSASARSSGRGDPRLGLAPAARASWRSSSAWRSAASACRRLWASASRRMRLVLGLGHRLLVARQRRLGLAPEPLRLVEIGGDPVLAGLQDLADPRQRLAAEQVVERRRSR